VSIIKESRRFDFEVLRCVNWAARTPAGRDKNG